MRSVLRSGYSLSTKETFQDNFSTRGCCPFQKFRFVKGGLYTCFWHSTNLSLWTSEAGSVH